MVSSGWFFFSLQFFEFDYKGVEGGLDNESPNAYTIFTVCTTLHFYSCEVIG